MVYIKNKWPTRKDKFDQIIILFENERKELSKISDLVFKSMQLVVLISMQMEILLNSLSRHLGINLIVTNGISFLEEHVDAYSRFYVKMSSLHKI